MLPQTYAQSATKDVKVPQTGVAERIRRPLQMSDVHPRQRGRDPPSRVVAVGGNGAGGALGVNGWTGHPLAAIDHQAGVVLGPVDMKEKANETGIFLDLNRWHRHRPAPSDGGANPHTRKIARPVPGLSVQCERRQPQPNALKRGPRR